jgi:phosphohistidine phosphatase
VIFEILLTMKTLYLLRHAKSSWQNSELNDFDRPLLEKGLKRSKLVIDYLLDHDVKVDLMISSPAARALATAEIFARALNYPVEEIRKERKIYFGDADSFYEQFFDVPKNVNTMMIVGHNPTITTFANQFLDNKIDYLPTSGIVSITFTTDQWEKAGIARSQVNFVVFPRMFRKE